MLSYAMATMLAVGVAAQDRPVVRFYGEAMCPGCAAAARSLVPNLLLKEGVAAAMDFEYVGYGNARKVGGKIVCQHGEAECMGNVAEACVKNATGAEAVRYMPFVVCLEDGAAITDGHVRECAAATGLDAGDISACVTDGRGAGLIEKEAEKTAAAGRMPYVPYFTFNGVPTQYSGLLSQVCNYLEYAGQPKPAGCRGVWAAGAHKKAEVKLFGEAMCPGCIKAAGFVLSNLLAKEGVADIMDFEYVAHGIALRTGPGGAFECQHGAAECVGNMAETVVKSMTEGNAIAYMPFDVCVEDGEPITEELVRRCAQQNGLDGEEVVAAMHDGRGARLQEAEAEKTEALYAGKSSFHVPYFTFNGVEYGNYYNLLADVCMYWEGEQPAGCRSFAEERCTVQL